MINTIMIDDYRAVINYDSEIDMFRGEFIGLSGGADFYATDIKGLHREGATSLKVFMRACKERDIDPIKSFSGRFNVRISPALHEQAAGSAAAEHKSLNQWVSDVLHEAAVVYKLD